MRYRLLLLYALAGLGVSTALVAQVLSPRDGHAEGVEAVDRWTRRECLPFKELLAPAP